MTKIEKTITFFSSVLLISSAAFILTVKYSEFQRREPVGEPEKKTESSRPDFSAIRIEVLNGCGREGIAAVFARKLRSSGFDVINGLGENADSFEYPSSVVIDRKGNKNHAELVAQAIGIRTVLTQVYDDPYRLEDVTVIIGRDWDTISFIEEVFKY